MLGLHFLVFRPVRPVRIIGASQYPVRRRVGAGGYRCNSSRPKCEMRLHFHIFSRYNIDQDHPVRAMSLDHAGRGR